MKCLFYVLSAVFLLGSCARQISPDVYDAGTIGQIESTYAGTIVSVQIVSIQNGDQLQDNLIGGIGGGVAGGMIGSTIGHGGGSLLGQIGGVIVGATVGAFTEQELKREQALQYIVQIENGEHKTIVQGTKPHLDVGEEVWVLVGHRGRSRIIPRSAPIVKKS